MDVFPVPRLFTRIPCADPVTALAVTETEVPAAAFLAKIPCFPAPLPTTVPVAFMTIAPVDVLST